MPTDPFDSLREPNIPLAPRPAFAAALRRRLSVALGATREEHAMAQPVLEVREYTPARLRSLTPYLATHDPAAAIDWYIEVFGAQLLGDPIVMPDGRIGHAELRIGDSVIMLAGEFPEEDHRSPLTLGGSTRRDPGLRARLRRDVRARGRAGRDAVAADRARTTARAAARSATRSATAGSCRRRSRSTTCRWRTRPAAASATSAT